MVEKAGGSGASVPSGDVQALKNGVPSQPTLSDIDLSKLKVTLAKELKDIPKPDDLVFGETMSDHMLVLEYTPEAGWSAPEIKPYGPLSLDPSASCFHYCTNIFEGMKAYLGPDGTPRLFRPELNMARLLNSSERVALPRFSPTALLELIKKLIAIDARWIPREPGCSLYIRPTMIGTLPSLAVMASTRATIFVILSPAGKMFKVPAGISLLAINDHVRAWPGGTGAHKLGLNYTPGFKPQRAALEKGYQQILWVLGDNITEAGGMNVAIVLKRPDGDMDIVTPPLDGTILPGITRASVLELLAAHGNETSLPYLSNKTRLHTHERVVTMSELERTWQDGTLLEAFSFGTAVVVTPIARIGWKGKDIELPPYAGNHLGPVARALLERLVDIQEGRVEWKGWSVPCET
ncbi:branched-chain amino acid aminotransferase II [Vararia minispora EC-137]|uniref:Branched-chain amino acid aminotransferase II n=1 Tax=Vararia minispora EC-137 TaxID=1314806 RepID=A0ACB8Q650_9AGAM|nr:branched-chain amino acid aminotransferase II [Vararia minispora EC-137]